MATAVTMTVSLVGTGKTSVQEMLMHLDTCFSTRGMMTFMESAVVPHLRARAQFRFDSQGDSASGPWAPLKPATVAIREAGIASGEFQGIGPSSPINIRTRDMEKYITQGRGEVVTEGSVGTVLHYPSVNTSARGGMQKKVQRAQYGDSRTPKRPVLAVDASDVAAVTSRLALFIEGKGYASRG